LYPDGQSCRSHPIDQPGTKSLSSGQARAGGDQRADRLGKSRKSALRNRTTIALEVGARRHVFGQGLLLVLGQARGPARPGAVGKTRKPLPVEAVDPVADSLPIHAAGAASKGTAVPVKHQPYADGARHKLMILHRSRRLARLVAP
jgi:hypothetical protein